MTNEQYVYTLTGVIDPFVEWVYVNPVTAGGNVTLDLAKRLLGHDDVVNIVLLSMLGGTVTVVLEDATFPDGTTNVVLNPASRGSLTLEHTTFGLWTVTGGLASATVVSASVAAKDAAVVAKVAAELAETNAESARDLAIAAKVEAEAAVSNAGVIPVATLDLTTNPTTGDSILIGGTTVEFKAAAEHVAADTNVAVEIGIDAAATFANLLAALNGTAPTPHATILLKAPSELPAISRSPALVVADAAATNVLRIMPSLTVGGAPLPGAAAIALNDALTAVVAWSVTNFNKTLGVSAATPLMSTGAYTITAGETEAVFKLPLTVAQLIVSIQDSTGVTKVSGTGTIVAVGSVVTITKGNLSAGDVVTFIAYGAAL